MEDFNAQQIKMGTTKHLTFQKFQAVDMPLRDAITFWSRAGSIDSGIIAINAVGKTG